MGDTLLEIYMIGFAIFAAFCIFWPGGSKRQGFGEAFSASFIWPLFAVLIAFALCIAAKDKLTAKTSEV